jgi:hypothetical protein
LPYAPGFITHDDNSTNNVSGLTTQDTEDSTPPPELNQDGQDALLSDLGGLTSDDILKNDVSITMDTNVSNTTGYTSSSSLGGRPKGSSNKATEITTKALSDSKNWCAIEYG